MRGAKVFDGTQLIFLNTKLEEPTKELMAALIYTLKLDGYRELFHVLLDAFQVQDPEAYQNAVRAVRGEAFQILPPERRHEERRKQKHFYRMEELTVNPNQT